MTKAEEIRLGPFVGGLDTSSDPTAIADTALSEIVNFELSDDGSLVNRPPIVSIGTPIPGFNQENPNYMIKILGYFTEGGATHLLATNNVDATYSYTGTSWVKIADLVFSAGVQFESRFWLIGNPASNTYQGGGGYWSPATGFVADANAPRGSSILAHKDRLWVSPGKKEPRTATRVYVSTLDSNDQLTWPSQINFVSVGGGDGQSVVDIKVHNADLVIFKENSTYRFSYADSPSSGSVTRVNASIGLENEMCIEEHEGIIYTIYQNKVYSFINYNFTPINTRVPLRYTSSASNVSTDQTLSIWADRLIVTHQNMTYVYKLNTRTWCVWESDLPGLDYLSKVIPNPTSRKDQPSAYITSSLTGDRANGSLWKITDAITTESEDMICYIRTKNYDYQTSSRFKKLFWWGVDMIGRQTQMEFIAHPVALSKGITWAQLGAYRWDQLKTWGRPLDSSIEQFDSVVLEGGSLDGRKFIKLLKALRFRQIGFTVRGTTKGDISSSPLRVFSVSTYVDQREQVVAKVS